MLMQTLLALGLVGRTLLPGMAALTAGAPEPQARYEPENRAVTNWRSEAIEALEPRTVVALAALFKAERPFVTRCVKLNNYWCIKSARWNGELATDGEGHVGFASAEHGADAAALLLKRYYLDFGRRSALDIVRRWAPPECGIATGIGGIAVLAVKGIGGTVWAQYLASRGKGSVVRYTARSGPGGRPGRVSMVIPMTPKTPQYRTPQYRVPDIAAGMGEKPKAPDPRPLVAQRPKPAPQPVRNAAATPKVQVASACGSEEQRLRNYASRMAEPLGLKPTDDLKLFAADGRPLPNLAPVMLAMSAVELGALRASPDLVEAAIERASAKVQENAKAMPQKAEAYQRNPQSIER